MHVATRPPLPRPRRARHGACVKYTQVDQHESYAACIAWLVAWDKAGVQYDEKADHLLHRRRDGAALEDEDEAGEGDFRWGRWRCHEEDVGGRFQEAGGGAPRVVRFQEQSLPANPALHAAAARPQVFPRAPDAAGYPASRPRRT